MIFFTKKLAMNKNRCYICKCEINHKHDIKGYSSGCESLSDARIRAKKASEILVEYAREHKYVVLVGHVFFICW